MGITRRRFVILHGWANEKPEGHWQRLLAERLTERGHEVEYPQLPNPHYPSLKAWTTAIEAAIDPDPGCEQVVIAHSLACAAWIHLAETHRDRPPVDRLVFVAPPGPKMLAETPELQDFQFPDGAHAMVAKTTRVAPRLVCSDNDRYCDPPADILYGDAFDVDAPAGCGHFDLDAHYGTWDSMLDWCEDKERRITARDNDAGLENIA
jgi:uncharacterized protein